MPLNITSPNLVNSPVSLEANLNSCGIRAAVIASRFNHFVVEKLAAGAIDGLVRHGADAGAQTIIWVPGAWELPLIAQKAARLKRFDAIICVGAIIKGETSHFDFVANYACSKIAQISLETGLPVTLGVLTVDNLEQAIDRSGGKMGNQGYNAALAAIECVNLLKTLE